jgi:23S rRNA (uracil-5-)-methyltransferase RumA
VTVKQGLRPGDPLAVTCRGLDPNGAALAETETAVLHVAGALPGERAEVTVEHVSPHRKEGRAQAWARLVRIEEPSPDRVSPVCPAYGPCGGCVLQHLAYEAQLRFKRERVAGALAGKPGLATVTVAACVPSPRPLGYRNQAKYVYGRATGGALSLGAYLPRSHALVDMRGCRVVEPVIDEVARVLHDILVRRDVPPFDEQRRTGILRYVVVRSSADGEALVTLVAAAPWGMAAEIADELRAAAPAVTGVVLNLNPTTGNVLFGSEETTLCGRPTLIDRIGPARVELASRSFFQVNRAVAGAAYEAMRTAAAALGPMARAVDVYSGAGGIAFTLAPFAGEVVAIEENAAATAAASAFAVREEAGVTGRVRFVTGDAAARLAELDSADLVVLNPPRSGCDPAVLEAVARLGPRLVAYLSCHPDTLARDLSLLGARFALRSVTPYDMLPHTPHVEALALLAPTAAPITAATGAPARR